MFLESNKDFTPQTRKQLYYDLTTNFIQNSIIFEITFKGIEDVQLKGGIPFSF